ncbi:MAG: DUF1501 domain-containing protein [Gemmatimonadales bacterium]
MRQAGGRCTRRDFIGGTGLAVATAFLPPALSFPGHTLVCVFLRGGADGLSLVVPHGDPRYRRARPTSAVPRVIDLDGYFGLHPGLEPLLAWWRHRQLLIAPAAGLPHRPAGHADAQSRIDRWLSSRGAARGVSWSHAARLIATPRRPAVTVIDVAGWDIHVDQGAATGLLAQRVHGLGRCLGRFVSDAGPRMRDVTVIVMSEFGRSVPENACGGTDHGHAGAVLAFGGAVRGGIRPWPGLAADSLPVRTGVYDLLDALAAPAGVTSRGWRLPLRPES